MTKKVALVTGAMGGLGTAICRALSDEGYVVAANCLPDFPERETWLARQREAGYEFHAVEADVTNYEGCAAMVGKIEAELGPIGVLVNNAGITRDKFFPKMNKDQWDAVIGTNLSSLFNVTHHVSPMMAERGWGRIINISSVNGVKGQAGQTNYSAAKAGAIGFTKALAQELVTKGVTVNAIAPGYIATEMVMAIRDDVRETIRESVPMKRFGKPEEIGGLVRYLSSELAGYITGATININGGLHMV
jgi:acetoacetyl-CoA reductase